MSTSAWDRKALKAIVWPHLRAKIPIAHHCRDLGAHSSFVNRAIGVTLGRRLMKAAATAGAIARLPRDI
eukprot:14795301-Alexandrium_andersonii.AAC.1